MWKQYLRPTKSSQAKQREQTEVKDRVHGLSRALHELKNEFKLETTSNELLTKNQRESQETLHRQVQALRTAFSDMADAFVDELETLRAELREEARQQREELCSKIDGVSFAAQQAEDTQQQLSTALTQTTKQTLQHVQALKTKQEFLAADLAEVRAQAEEARPHKVFQEVKAVIERNSAHIAQLFAEVQGFREKSAQPSSADLVKDSLAKFKDKCQVQWTHFERSLQDLALRPVSSSDTDLKFKHFTDQFSHSLELLQQEVRKPSAVPELEARITYIEELITTQRRELFASLTGIEQAVAKKQDKLVRAVHALSRHTGLAETTLSL